MDIENLKPVIDKPAILTADKKTLVIADLHIGIEKELNEKGFNIPDRTNEITSSVLSLCKTYEPTEIILLGDIKHNVPLSLKQERRNVKKFLDTIKEYADIHIVRGNHDGNIQKIAPSDIHIHPSRGFIKDGIGFFHGHSWPCEDVLNCRIAIMAHTHPTVMLVDRLGHRSFEPCWVRASISKDDLKERYPNSKCFEILIMPAFNPLCGGIAVNCDSIMGPFRKLIDIDNSQAYLLDGTLVGKIRDIKVNL